MNAHSCRIFLLSISILGITSCSSKNEKKDAKDNKNAPVAIDVSIAKLEKHSNPVEANGSVLAFEYVELKPEVAGRITQLNIKEGMPVSEGTLLVKLNDEDLQAQLRKYRSQLDLAVKNEKRLKSLLSVNGLNQADYDQALVQVNNLNADIDYTLAMIAKTEIRAPFSGTVGLRNVSKGAYVTQQNIIATIQQTNALKVDFVLPEIYASAVKQGLKVKVINDKGISFNATVIGIEPQVNTSTRNLKIRAILESGASVSPGSFVRVVFNEGEERERILINTNSIIPETRFKKVVLIKNGVAEFVKVETGFRSESKVEIISGLTAGDTFAINGILFLKPGSPIKIKSVK